VNNRNGDVDKFLEELEHPLKELVQRVRLAILAEDAEITEHIKWNAPSFCIDGDDRVTMNLHAKDKLQLIFHRGAKAKEGGRFKFEDPSGLLDWLAKDRAVVRLASGGEYEDNEDGLLKLVSQWMEATRPQMPRLSS
jgi:hypothetical protein